MSPTPQRDARTRLLRFVIVGVGAAALLFCLSWLLVTIGLSPFLGSVIAYGVAMVVSYTAQRGWTFGGAHAHGRALPRYLTLQIGCAAFSGLVSHVAVSRFGMAPLAMSAAMTLIVSAASFVVSSLWVFPVRD